MQRLNQTERILKALANRRRLAILLYLKNTPNSSVGNIAEHIRLSFKATSKHLGILSGADIVQKQQQSLNVHYSLAVPISATTKTILSQL